MTTKHVTEVSEEQIDLLMTFISKKGGLNSIQLTYAESKLFLNNVDSIEQLESTQLFLHQGFAEVNTYTADDYLHKIIIPREKLIGDIDFYVSYTPDVETSDIYYNPFMKTVLRKYIRELGLESLLEKLSVELSQMYPISKGQCQALMKRVMGFTMSSGDRSFIHDLRKKLIKYSTLIDEFHEYVMKPEETSSYGMKWVHRVLDYVESEKQHNITEIDDDRLSEFYEAIRSYSNRPEEDRQVLKLEKSVHISHAPVSIVCSACGYQEKIANELLELDEPIAIPLHCGQQMIMKISHDSN